MVANHTISILVINEAGVLSRVTGLFSGRGYNIESLTVAPCLDCDYSRITLVTQGDDNIIEQITKQLNRLIPVIKVVDLTVAEATEREFVFCKVNVKDETRSEILRIAELGGAKIIDTASKTYTLEACGDEKQISTMIELLRPIGIKEIVRSGKVAISKENTFNKIKCLNEEGITVKHSMRLDYSPFYFTR